MPNPPSNLPPGWHHNPSRYLHRAPVVALAYAGLCISIALALFQFGQINHIWEPLFGNGSRQVLLHSIISRHMPFPDALLGAIAYCIELILSISGPRDRWRSAPWLVLLSYLVILGLCLVALTLVCMQAFVAHAFCTLCLCSAVCSVAMPFLAVDELLATLHHLNLSRHQRHSLWHALTARS